MWSGFYYSEIQTGRFDKQECERIISLHQEKNAQPSQLPQASGGLIRDCDLFWIPRTAETEWIFARIWSIAETYNVRYRFDLVRDMGQLQLTRYTNGQHYNWHMDLGGGPMSLRKVSVVVELGGEYEGGGLEVFYGEGTANRMEIKSGDAVVFPSFIMHRAMPVTSGTRWSLVSWLLGPQPLQ